MTTRYEQCQVHRIANKPGWAVARRSGSIVGKTLEGFHSEIIKHLSINGWEQKGSGVDPQGQQVIYFQRPLPGVRKTLNTPKLASWRTRVKNAKHSL